MTNPDCIFCKIANHTQDSNILHETPELMIIQDIMPKAPVHVLVLPKKHIQTVSELGDEDGGLMGQMILAARDYAAKVGVDKTGYKLVLNNGKQGGQIVPHLHMHFLGGKQLEE